jgi:hypothetical protein
MTLATRTALPLIELNEELVEIRLAWLNASRRAGEICQRAGPFYA